MELGVKGQENEKGNRDEDGVGEAAHGDVVNPGLCCGV